MRTFAPPTGGRSPAAILRRAAPALIGMVVIAGLGVGALWVGASNLREAEQNRLENRIDAVGTMVGNLKDNTDPGRIASNVVSQPFNPAGGPVNELLLQQWRTSDAPEAYVGLLATDGRSLGSVPANAAIDVADLGSAWDEAVRTGEPALTEVFRHNGGVVNATLLPVGSPAPWGVVVIVEPALTSPSQGFQEQIGSLNGEPGGLVVVDRRGVALYSWSRAELGTAVVPPDAVADLPTGSARAWTAAPGGTATTYVGSAVGHGYSLVFEQATADLYGDLREAQGRRDLSLSGVLGVALLALLAFLLWREAAARRAAGRLHALLKNSQDLVLVAGDDGRMRFVSPAAEGLLGVPPETITGAALADLCHPEDVRRAEQLLVRPDSGPLLNVRLRAAHDGFKWFDIEASDLSAHPEVGGVLLTCHGIGDRKRLQDELLHQASHDRLTGLPNRAELGARLERMVDGDRPVRPFALLYVDLDHFKPVNDALGHDAGDEVLVTVSKRLQATLGPDDLVSRLGGDEFALLLDGADEERAVAVAGQLISTVRSPVVVGQKLVHLDASIGIALAAPGRPLANVESLVRRADAAMYRAKQSGRGRYAFAEVHDAGSYRSTTPVVDVSAAAGRTGGDTHAADLSAPPGPPASPADLAHATAGAPRPERRVKGLVPMLIAAAVVLPIAAVGWRQAAEGERVAEADYLRSQEQFVVRAAGFYSSLYDSGRLTQTASNAPWTLDGSAVDAKVAEAFATSPSAGRDATAILATPDGRILAASPPTATLNVPTSAPVWQEALRGEGNMLSLVQDPDQPRSVFVLPVQRDGRVAALLALGISTRYGPGQVALEKAGSAGFTTGGWSLLNATGEVYLSWNPELVGTPMVEPGRLTGLTAGSVRNLSDDDQVLIVSPMTSTIDPTYLIFAMPAADFYKDQRLGQTPRALSFLLLVIGAVAGLAFVNNRRERAARRSEARLDALLQSAHDVIVVLDDRGRATFTSSASRRLLGYAPAERTGRQLLDLVHPEDHDRLAAMVTDAHARGATSVVDVRVRAADDRYRWFDLTAVDLRDHREVRGLLLTCHEVTERRALQDQLAYRARHDPLTGLPNRSVLSQLMEQLATADEPSPFAVLFIDLDYFKAVNDRLGHDAGDEVLRVIAQRFEAGVRLDGEAGDVVCRVGGDEFAVVLRDATETDARATAERLIDAAKLPIALGGHTVNIGATIGVSMSHPSPEHPDVALRRADQAMYRAKEAGRGTYSLSDAELSRPEVAGAD